MDASEDISHKHPVRRASGQPAREVLTSLNFLATDNSVTLTGCSPSEGTRVQYFRASLIYFILLDSPIIGRITATA